MPIKKTKKIDLWGAKKSAEKTESKIISKKDAGENSGKSTEKSAKQDIKKVVVRRRKTDLKPTKASAVAIISQANRAKKQALIERVAKSDIKPVKEQDMNSDNKIPLWVWTFFWCSLLLFCVSLYQAYIRPQIQKENVVISKARIDENELVMWDYHEMWDDENIVQDWDFVQEEMEQRQRIDTPETADDLIGEFFRRLSNRDFDWAFDLMIPALRGYSDIRTHFTSLRMDPFLDWIVWWKLVPENIKYIKSSAQWKDVYNFDLSYVLEGNQEKYEETWEIGVNTHWEIPKIFSIRCISSKCSYHPIFWPENFGLMR